MTDNATNSVTGITPDNVVDDVAGSNDAHEAPTFVQLTVRSVERDTDKSVVVTFETSTLDRPELLAFRHGQHLTLRREFDGVEFRRSYSLCSAAPDGPLRVAVRQIPGGVFSTWANTELQAGDRLDVMTPAGHFTHELMPTEARRYTMLAAGSGITPVFSIMSTILRHEPEALVRLVYVNQTSRSTMLLEELERLRDRYLGRIQIWYAFTREETDATLLSGRPDRDRLDALIRARVLASDADHAFLCGPIDLVQIAQDALIDAGMARERVHRELFTARQVGASIRMAPQEVDAGATPVAVGRATLHGRNTSFEMFEGDSVLDAVQRVRPDAPFSCRSGVCSTCQAVLLDGEVEMAVNYGLSDDEVERGYVLTCQSTALTDSVSVNYDA